MAVSLSFNELSKFGALATVTREPGVCNTGRLLSYDLLMFAAIVTMLIDHIGYFFLNDVEELRIVGRIAAPIFLFLAGYGRNHVKPVYALLGAAMTVFKGGYPLDILMLFFLLAVSYEYVFKRLTEGMVFSGVVLFSLVMVGIQIELETYILNPYLNYVAYGFLYFYAGKALYNNRLAYSVGCLLIGLFLQFGLYAFIYDPIMLGIAIGVLLNLFAFFYNDVCVMKRPARAGILRVLSRYSLDVYVWHIAIFALVARFL
jgi:hypothetical protein